MSEIHPSAPHPKPEPRKRNKARRVEDGKAIQRAKLAYPHCAACGVYGGNGHHVLPKDRGGDDVVENIVVLCGSGTSRCHGAHHGNPYVVTGMPGDEGLPFEDTVTRNARRDAQWVNMMVGQTLLRERQDVIAYILEKLGDRAGRVYLADTYYVDL